MQYININVNSLFTYLFSLHNQLEYSSVVENLSKEVHNTFPHICGVIDSD